MLLQLASDEVHCWSVRLDVSPETCAGLYATLAADERNRSGRFRFERDRRRFVVARGALRDVLGRYVGTRPDQIRFAYNPFGKPELSPEIGRRVAACCAPTSRVRFNVSHSADLAIIAVAADTDVGVDLERVREADYTEIVRYFFSAAEVDELNTVPSHVQAQAFFSCWTKREAYVKARGEGLVDGPVEFCGRWSFFPLQPAQGYIGTLAVAGNGWRLRQGHWFARDILGASRVA